MTSGKAGQFPAYKTVPVADLIPYARNSRTHSDAQVAKIAASIREFGFLNPIIVDGANGIVAGHGRVMAAQKLGMETVPVVEAAHLTEAQKRAYVIADNRLALDAGWDEEMLKIELADLGSVGFDLTLTGFEIGEIEGLNLGGDDGGGGDGGLGAGTGSEPKGSLADRFGIPPFTVLRAAEGWWQDRKRAWLALGIQSELGRGENLAAMGGALERLEAIKGKAKTFHDGAVLGKGGLADQVAAAATARRKAAANG